MRGGDSAGTSARGAKKGPIALSINVFFYFFILFFLFFCIFNSILREAGVQSNLVSPCKFSLGGLIDTDR
jgi:hypothetical protein